MEEKIILILLGVFSFILGQYILKFYIEKYNNYIETKLKIINYMKLRANKIANFNIDKELSSELRELSCNLYSNFHVLPYPIRKLKKYESIENVIDGLMGLSNSLGKDDSKFIREMYKKVTQNTKNL